MSSMKHTLIASAHNVMALHFAHELPFPRRKSFATKDRLFQNGGKL